MVGKDALKWKDGMKAIVWRKRRHVLFQRMYEQFGIMPLIVITSMGMEVQWRRDMGGRVWKRGNDMESMDEMEGIRKIKDIWKKGWKYVGVWIEDEHDKDYGRKDMDRMSRSNIWKDYGSIYDNVWIMCKGYVKWEYGWMEGKW